MKHEPIGTDGSKGSATVCLLTDAPIATNYIHGGWTTVTPAQGSLSLSIIIHKRDTGSSAPLRHRVVRKHMPPFFTFPTAGPQARDCQHTLFLRGFSGCVLALTRARSITFHLAFSDPQLPQDGPRPGAT